MANVEHLEILKLGFEKWNEWRTKNKGVIPNLSSANLSSASLTHADLTRTDLSDADLTDADLTGANLSDASLSDADLTGANLTSANLFRIDLTRADLTGTNLTCAHLSDADLTGANLRGANLTSANLFRTDLTRADSTRANLTGANLTRTNLTDANLTRANLTDANLTRANLTDANLLDANLTDVNLTDTNLFHADLTRANLIGANLIGANLTDANLTRANLIGANLTRTNLTRANFTNSELNNTDLSSCKLNATIFGLTDLSTCNGLKSVNVYAPCIIDFSTLRASKNLPKEFLTKLGIPDLLMEYLPDFYNPALMMYPAFLSHSWGDKEFVYKMYEALTKKGITVWLDEKKMKPGDNIHDSIAEGIKYYDKLILVCSENSLNSWWVEKELERVYEKERQLQKQHGKKFRLVIPIRLDNRIFKFEGGIFDMLRNSMIGDFTHWQDEKEFEKSLKELVDALDANRPDIKPPSFLVS